MLKHRSRWGEGSEGGRKQILDLDIFIESLNWSCDIKFCFWLLGKVTKNPPTAVFSSFHEETILITFNRFWVHDLIPGVTIVITSNAAGIVRQFVYLNVPTLQVSSDRLLPLYI